MNMKLIITGLVALGLVGQITGQTPSEPDGIPTTESFTSESWSIEGLVNPLDATGETTAKIKVRGKERLYQCEDGRIPPNCNFADPPIEINQCGAWKHIFHVNYGVTCPPDFPTQMIYWVARCSGGYSEITRWNISWRGNCQRGYEAFNGLLEGESPDCARDIRQQCCQFADEVTPVDRGTGFEVGNYLWPPLTNLCDPNYVPYILQVDAVGANGEVLAFHIALEFDTGNGYLIPPPNPVWFSSPGYLGNSFGVNVTYRTSGGTPNQ